MLDPRSRLSRLSSRLRSTAYFDLSLENGSPLAESPLAPLVAEPTGGRGVGKRKRSRAVLDNQTANKMKAGA